MTEAAAELRAEPTGPLRILHLSDTHLLADGALHHGSVDTDAALRRVLAHATPLTGLDLVVASGDLSDDGSHQSYARLRALLEPWAAQRGASVVYAMGNHDASEGFEAELGARTAVTTRRGYRIVVLDSAVPGAGYGAVEAGQLDLLRDAIAEPAPFGTVVVVHHPPVPAETPLLAALELQSPEELLAACAGGDVRLILCGHYHHPLATRAFGIDVLVAPAVANRADVLAPAGRERATTGSGYALVELPPTGSPRVLVMSAPAPDDGRTIFDLTPEEVSGVSAAAGPPRIAG